MRWERMTRYRKNRSSSLDARHRNVDLVNHAAGNLFPVPLREKWAKRSRISASEGKSFGRPHGARRDRKWRRRDSHAYVHHFSRMTCSSRPVLSWKRRSGIVSIALWMHPVFRDDREKKGDDGETDDTASIFSRSISLFFLSFFFLLNVLIFNIFTFSIIYLILKQIFTEFNFILWNIT